MKVDVKKEAGLTKKELSWIGENEVFETNCISRVYADLLNGKCRVWNVLEYDGRSDVRSNEYYTRAKFSIETVFKI